jgi:hypothetical protein
MKAVQTLQEVALETFTVAPFQMSDDGIAEACRNGTLTARKQLADVSISRFG